MAKKTKRIKAHKRRGPARGPIAPSLPASAASSVSPALPPALPPRPAPEAPRRSAPRGGVTETTAVPLEKVPYFLSDLRRIGITAGAMVVLIVAGSLVLPNALSALFR
jgi:hypothetical protein